MSNAAKFAGQPGREQWIIGTAMAGAVNACNAPFCEDNPAENTPGYIDEVAGVIASHSSPMAIEDAIQVLEAALKIARSTPVNV